MGGNKNNILNIIIGAMIVLDIFVWGIIFFPMEAGNPQLYFLDVGQGDSSLVVLPGGAKMLIDGGQLNGKLQENLEELLPLNDRYIDLVMVSHPQLDHFGGLIDIIKTYKVGAVLTSDQKSGSANWNAFEKAIQERKIPRVVLAVGDVIRYGGFQLEIISPRKGEWAKDMNDMSLVAILESDGVRAFFGGDIGAAKEKELAEKYDTDVDVLKVSHHGSKYSSDPVFLKEASPLVSVIGVGKNSYGHPTPQALSRLANIGSQVYRTDESGILKLIIDGVGMKVYTQK